MPNREHDLGQNLEVSQLSISPPTGRGSERWNSWQWKAIIVSGAVAGFLVSMVAANEVWPQPIAAGLRSLAEGFGAAIGGFLVPTIAYNRQYINTWFGRS